MSSLWGIKINWKDVAWPRSTHNRLKRRKSHQKHLMRNAKGVREGNWRMFFMKNPSFPFRYSTAAAQPPQPRSRRRSVISKVSWWIRRHENRKTWQRFSWMSFGSRKFYASASRKFFLLCCRKYFLQFNVVGALAEYRFKVSDRKARRLDLRHTPTTLVWKLSLRLGYAHNGDQIEISVTHFPKALLIIRYRRQWIGGLWSRTLIDTDRDARVSIKATWKH